MFRQLLVPLVALSLVVVACSSHGGSSLPSVSAPSDSSQTSTQRAPESTLQVATSAGYVSKLGRYHIDRSKVFVAGISSGGFFAVQMHVAHSATFKGAAVYAGGVYFCAQDSVAIALAACGGEGLYAPELTQSEAYLDAQSKLGTIDPESNLADRPVYLWSGTADTVVPQASMNDLDSEYAHYRASPIVYDSTFPAEHGWESPDGALSCGTLGEPYMIECDRSSQVYDSEKTWLTMFLGTLHSRNDGKLTGTFEHFDQTEFGAAASNSMDTNGWVYVPQSCASGKIYCALVVAFHGCQQNQSLIGNAFAAQSGIDEWADTNDVIVLYPYAIVSSTVPYNPKGCWDWWGYDDPNYATKSGTQISIVYKMVQRVEGY